MRLFYFLNYFGAIIKSVDSVEEHQGILLDLLGRLAVLHVHTDVFVVVRSVQLEGLYEFQKILAFPIRKAFFLNEFLLNLHFRSEQLSVAPLNKPIVLGLELEFDEFLEALWVREESEVGDAGQSLLLSLIRYPNVTVTVYFWTKIALG